MKGLSTSKDAVYMRLRYRTDPEFRRRKAERQARPEAKARQAAINKAKRLADPRWRWVSFERALRRNHGMSVEEYAWMEYAQSCRCKLCRDPLCHQPATRSVHVDHDHLTNKIRGLLCSLCNGALGQVREHPDRARRVAAYIEAHW